MPKHQIAGPETICCVGAIYPEPGSRKGFVSHRVLDRRCESRDCRNAFSAQLVDRQLQRSPPESTACAAFATNKQIDVGGIRGQIVETEIVENVSRDVGPSQVSNRVGALNDKTVPAVFRNIACPLDNVVCARKPTPDVFGA